MKWKKSSESFSLLKFFCDGQKVSPSSKTDLSVSVIVLLDRLTTRKFNLGFLTLLDLFLILLPELFSVW